MTQYDVLRPVVLYEPESPRQALVGNLSHYLRVHQVAYAYAAGSDARGYGYIVEHCPDRHFEVAHVEQQSQNESQGASV